jgi:hypothetical protein
LRGLKGKEPALVGRLLVGVGLSVRLRVRNLPGDEHAHRDDDQQDYQLLQALTPFAPESYRAPGDISIPYG